MTNAHERNAHPHLYDEQRVDTTDSQRQGTADQQPLNPPMAKRKRVCSAFSGLILAGGLLLSPTFGTQSATAVSFCSYAADAEMLVGKTPQGYYFDDRISNGTAYYSQDCRHFYTVDMTVPGTYKDGVSNAITIAGGFDQQASPLTELNCKAASEAFVIYKRTRNALGTWSDWQLVNSQNVQEGTWVPFVDMGYLPYCALSVPIRVVAPSSVLMVDQYRVMVQPKLSGVPVQVRVEWQWAY